MIADARAKSFDVLVCHKIDRFSRDRYDHSHYKRILQKNNIKLEYVDQRIDDTPEGALTESLLIGLSEYYSRNLAREVMKGMNERAHKGLFNGGIPPLGYSIDADKKYVINEHEAAAVRHRGGAPGRQQTVQRRGAGDAGFLQAADLPLHGGVFFLHPPQPLMQHLPLFSRFTAVDHAHPLPPGEFHRNII